MVSSFKLISSINFFFAIVVLPAPRTVLSNATLMLSSLTTTAAFESKWL